MKNIQEENFYKGVNHPTLYVLATWPNIQREILAKWNLIAFINHYNFHQSQGMVNENDDYNIETNNSKYARRFSFTLGVVSLVTPLSLSNRLTSTKPDVFM